MAPGLTHVTTVREAPEASLPASAFRTKPGKIIRLGHLDEGVFMSRAAKAQGVADGIRGPEHIDDLLPHTYVRIGIRVANKIHAMLSTTKENINSIRRP